MGKGTIVGGGADGLYTVDIDTGSAYIAGLLAALQTEIDQAQAAIDALEPLRLEASVALIAAQTVLDAAIDDYRDQPVDERDIGPVDEASQAVIKAGSTLNVIEVDQGRSRVIIANNTARMTRLAAEPVTRQVSAWCTTYTEDAAGEVATIELNGESDTPIIAPEGRPYVAAQDGDYRDRLAVTGAAAWLNAALLPGWQRFKPTYRSGVLTAIDTENDEGTVDLDPATSSAQDLPINAVSTVTAPIEYLTCNAGAFEVGDRVVVQFVGQDWSNPKVIGFVDNPRPCQTDLLCFPAFVSGIKEIRTARAAAGVSGQVVTTSEFSSPRIKETSSIALSEVVSLVSPPTNIREELHHNRITIWTESCWKSTGDGWQGYSDGSIVVGGGNMHLWPATTGDMRDICRFQTELQSPAGIQLRVLVDQRGEWSVFQGVWDGPPVDANGAPDTGDPTWTPVLFPGDPITAEAPVGNTRTMYVSSGIGELDDDNTTSLIQARYNIPTTITVTEGGQESTYKLKWAGARPDDFFEFPDGGRLNSVVVDQWYFEVIRQLTPVGVFIPPQVLDANNRTFTTGPMGRTLIARGFNDVPGGFRPESGPAQPAVAGFLVVYEKQQGQSP